MSKWDAQTADWYAEKYGEYATNRLAVDALDLAPTCTIVDIGCGTGAALRHASTRAADARLIGVDPIERMIEIAVERTASRAGHPRIDYRVGPAERLPIEDAIADVVFAFDSFDHWQDQQAGLREVTRIMKPGGRLVVVKDGGLPGGEQAQASFLEELAAAGLLATSQQNIGQDGIAFTMWVCTASPTK